MRLAWDLGIRALILEGDAKIVMDSFDSGAQDLSHTGIILNEACNIASGFHFFKLTLFLGIIIQ